jgi:hypothetical protein
MLIDEFRQPDFRSSQHTGGRRTAERGFVGAEQVTAKPEANETMVVRAVAIAA